MTIGEKIREARIQKGLTQKQLGEACGMKETAIGRYERNGAHPKYETLQRIAKALDVSVRELLSDGNFYEGLAATYYTGIMRWSHDRFFSEEDSATISMLFSELLLRYKALIEKFQRVKLSMIGFLDTAGMVNSSADKPLSRQDWINAYLKKCISGEIENFPETYTADEFISFFVADDSTNSAPIHELMNLYLKKEMEKEIDSLAAWIEATPLYCAYALEKSLELNKNAAPGATNTESGKDDTDR